MRKRLKTEQRDFAAPNETRPFCCLLLAILTETAAARGVPQNPLFAEADGAVYALDEAKCRTIIERLIQASDAGEAQYGRERDELAQRHYEECQNLIAAYPVSTATV